MMNSPRQDPPAPSPYAVNRKGRVTRNAKAGLETEAYKPQQAASTAMLPIGLLTQGAHINATAGFLAQANPRGRFKQMKADQSYLDNSRRLDALEGMPKISHVAQVALLEVVATAAEVVRDRYLSDLDVEFAPAAKTSSADPLQSCLFTHTVKVSASNRKNDWDRNGPRGRRWDRDRTPPRPPREPFPPKPPGPQAPPDPTPPDLQDLRKRMQELEFAEEAERLRKQIKMKELPPNSFKRMAMEAGQSLGNMGSKLGRGGIALLGGAAMLGGINYVRGEIGEALREHKKDKIYAQTVDAMLGDMGTGNPTPVRRLFEEDPEAAHRALRPGFDLMFKYAPDVTNDPVLASQYMQRLALDPRGRLPPEEYARQVRDLLSVQRDLSDNRPDVADGLSSLMTKFM